jgi:hypothetical protein
MPIRIPLTAEEILKTFERDRDGDPIASKWQWVALSLVQKEFDGYECKDHDMLVSIRSHLEKWDHAVNVTHLGDFIAISIAWPSAV